MINKSGFKKFAIILAVFVIGSLLMAACASATTTQDAASEIPKPSNPGGTGPALSLTGDATAGAAVFTANCVQCHGDKGVGGVANPGSDDGTVPPVNPIDAGLVNKDPAVFASNIDLFIEHGSTPEGDSPALKMASFGDSKTLTPQQIADVMAYIISLNPAK